MLRLFTVEWLVALGERFGGRSLSSVAETFDARTNVFFAGLAHDAADDLALLVEDDGAGDDVAQADAGHHIGVSANPDVHRQFLLGYVRGYLGVVFGLVDGDGDEADTAGGIFLSEFREARELISTGSAPRSPEANYCDRTANGVELLLIAGEIFELEIGDSLALR